MNATLKVKNFGPIKDVELDLRDVNVFIGPQASGKSVLAKLYTICKSPSLFLKISNSSKVFDGGITGYIFSWDNCIPDEDVFKQSLQKFSLLMFLKDDTEIEFVSAKYELRFIFNQLEYYDKLGLEVLTNSDLRDNLKAFNERMEVLKTKSKFLENALLEKSAFENVVKYDDSDADSSFLFLRLSILWTFKRLNLYKTCNYIPSERTLAVLLKNAALNLMHQRVPIPEHLLEFAANYNSASDKIRNLDLSYLKSSASYKNIDGEDFILDDDTTLKLSESASGLQSVVPLLLTLENLKNSGEESAFHQAFVIEEPETNLFPKAQYALLKCLERNRPDDDGKIDTGSVHIYTTHSPFILSSLNNMLYAYKKGNAASPSVQEEIAKVLPKENWISPERFSAYQIIDGKAESIFDRESGLIQENIIDQISDDIIEDFRSIAIATMES